MAGASRSCRGIAGWEELSAHFTLLPGTRQIFDIAVESVQTSCGWGVPVMALERERPTLIKAHAQADPAEWAGKYKTRRTSIDGLPVRTTDRYIAGDPGAVAAGLTRLGTQAVRATTSTRLSGTDGRRDADRILTVLHEVDADIVALQEVDRRFGRRASVLPRLLVEEQGYQIVPLSMRPDSMGWHGNALLVRRGIEILEAEPIHLPTLEPRGAVRAVLSMRRGASACRRDASRSLGHPPQAPGAQDHRAI